MNLVTLWTTRDVHWEFQQEGLSRLFGKIGRVRRVIAFFYAPSPLQPHLPMALIEFENESDELEALFQYNSRVVANFGLLRVCITTRKCAAASFAKMYSECAPQRDAPEPLPTAPLRGVPDLGAARRQLLSADADSAPADCELCWIMNVDSELFYVRTFDFIKHFVGSGQCNIYYILAKCGRAVKISFKNSALMAGRAGDQLHLQLVSAQSAPFWTAVTAIMDLLTSVCSQYVDFALANGLPLGSMLGCSLHFYSRRVDKSSGKETICYEGYKDLTKSWSETILKDVPLTKEQVFK